MQAHNEQNNDDQNKESSTANAMQDSGAINISGYIRVFDPNTQQTLVEARE